MRIDFQCPNGHPMSADEQDIGERLTCDECDTTVRVPAPSVPLDAVTAEVARRPRPPRLPEEHDSVDLPRRRKRRRTPPVRTFDHPYHRIRIGLSLHYAWILVYLISIALTMLALLVASPALLALNFVVWIALFFAKPILGIIGSIFCLRVPSGANAKPFLWTSIGLDAVSLVVGALFFLLGAYAAARRGQAGAEVAALAVVFLGINYLCNYLAWVFLLVFVHKFAVYVTDWGTSSEAIPVGALGTILLLSPVLAVVLIAVLAPILPRDVLGMLLFFGYVLLLVWVVACVKVFLRNLAMLSGLREHLLKQIEKA